MTPEITTFWNADKTILYVKGLFSGATTFTEIEGYNIDGVKIYLKYGCESSCEDNYELVIEVPETGTLVDGSYVFALDSEDFDIGDEFEDGIYHVKVEWTLSNEDVEELLQYEYSCNFKADQLKCDIVDYILNTDESDNLLVNSYNALLYSVECNDCCKMCEIYELIQSRLSEC